MGQWTAEVTNDPNDGFQLYFELLEDEKYRGRVSLGVDGNVLLTVYSSPDAVIIPSVWLCELLAAASGELLLAREEDELAK
jgi:hypothetical protein